MSVLNNTVFNKPEKRKQIYRCLRWLSDRCSKRGSETGRVRALRKLQLGEWDGEQLTDWLMANGQSNNNNNNNINNNRENKLQIVVAAVSGFYRFSSSSSPVKVNARTPTPLSTFFSDSDSSPISILQLMATFFSDSSEPLCCWYCVMIGLCRCCSCLVSRLHSGKYDNVKI